MFFAQGTILLDLIKTFLFTKKAENVSAGTSQFYKQKLTTFHTYCQLHSIEQISQIDSTIVRNYLLFLRDSRHNAGGIHAHFRVVRTFLRWYEKEFEPENWNNPVTKIKAPKVILEPLEPVSFDDVERMIKACHSNLIGCRDKAIMLFLLDSGVRASELLDIQLEEIDILTGEVFIRKGKGRKPRHVYLGERSRKSIRQYLKLRNDRSPALWVTDEGTPLTYWGLVSQLKRLSQRANVPTPSIHSFRYAFALAALRNGMDVFSLQKAGGWATMGVMRRYLKQTEVDVEAAMKKFSPVDNRRKNERG